MKFIIFSEIVELSRNDVYLVPLSDEHEQGLAEATQDGELWKLNITSTPHYTEVKNYIDHALKQKIEGSRYPFVVIDKSSGKILGTTSYHDIKLDVKKFEIGYTWYAKSVQRTHVNTLCKFLLLQYAFDQLKIETVGFRTDILNLKSQCAIERLGAIKDGVIRGDALRKDGSIRDTVMYSITKNEWKNIKRQLDYLIE